MPLIPGDLPGETGDTGTAGTPAAPAVARSSAAAPAGRTAAPTQTQSLYRRYRPQSFDADDLVGQEHIVRTLRNAVERDRVAHAYLFCGPRGTGKTTTARLLAKAVNCLDPDPRARPCNRCAACVAITTGATTDVIEIDAASNRGIDDIRDLRERIKYAPTQLRSKFYIIDEAHQITGAAGNAFLKTLEEPPAHTKFVLATTDPEDLLATIVSRCQRFDFRRIALPAAIARLRTVAAAEGIAVDDDALAAIARAGTGSLRDSLGLLDQLSVYQESDEASDGQARVTADSVRALLGVSRNDRVETIVRALADRDVSAALGTVNGAVEAGEDPRQLNRQLVTYLRVLMHELAGGSPDADATARELAGRFDLYDLARMAQRFSETDVRIRHAAIAQLPFEVALVETILRPPGAAVEAAPARPVPAQRPEPARQPSVAAAPIAAAPERIAPSPSSVDTGETESAQSAAPQSAEPEAPAPAPARTSLKDRVRDSSVRIGQPVAETPAESRPPAPTGASPMANPATGSAPTAPAATGDGGEVTVQRLVELWGRIRQDVKLQNRRVEALLAEVDPIAVNGDLITLRAAYPFHRNRLEEDEVRQVVEATIGKRVGQPVRVRTVLKNEDGEEGALQLVPVPPGPAPASGPPPAPEIPTPRATATTAKRAAAPEPPATPIPATPAYMSEPEPDDYRTSADAPADHSAPGHEPDRSALEDDDRLVEAARTIFDGEEIPDPLAGEP